MIWCFAILTVAALCDAYSGRIPRQITCLGMMVSQLWVLYHSSVSEALTALIGGLGLLLILYPLFMIGTLGAGDIKLIMILPAYMTFADALSALFFSFVAGACIGSVRLIATGTLYERLRFMKTYIERLTVSGKPVVYDLPASCRRGGFPDHQIHFSIPILIGCALQLGGIISL